MSQAALLTAMNAWRAVALDAEAILMRVAQSFAEEMAATGNFSHYGKDGSTPWDRAALAGYPGSNLAENIAWGQRDATECVADWMASRSVSTDRQVSEWATHKTRGHAANLTNPSYKVAGCGVARGKDGQLFWVAMFGAVGGGPVVPPPPPPKPLTFWEWLAKFLRGAK